MNIITITIRLVPLTILFWILMFAFNLGGTVETLLQNVFILKKVTANWWNFLIPVIIADLSIFIWLVIDYIRFDPKEDVTDKE